MTPRPYGRLLALLLAALLAVILRLAWLGDDAYITLRTVEHFVEGQGLRWNAAERAQTYTHPLWMFLLVGCRLCTGETYFGVLALSTALALFAALGLLRSAGHAAAMVAVAALLLTTRAFPEYATSGLENPLTYALLAAFVIAHGREQEPVRRFGRCALLGGLLALNRMDLLVLVAPPLLASMRAVPLRSVLGRGLLGLLPLAAWLAFSAFYYGTPFPTTAYAKLGIGVGTADLLRQGSYYCWHAARTDPVLVAAITAGSVLGLAGGRLHRRALAIGVVLYSVYVVRVGGDFMQGRLLSPPFVVAAAILARTLRSLSGQTCLAVAAGTVGLSLAAGLPPWCHGPATDTRSKEPIAATRGVIDERRFYYEAQGLFSPTRNLPVRGSLEQLVWPAGRTRDWIFRHDTIGRVGYEVSAKAFIVDDLLCDPLLMRLPIHDPATWRPGHAARRIPEGYLETLATGENRIWHPGLRRYYETLRRVLRDPLWSADRWQALLDLWLGRRDADLAAFIAEDYRSPPRVRAPLAAFATPVPAGAFWFDEPSAHLVYEGGLEVPFDAPRRVRRLAVQVLGVPQFRFTLRRQGAAVAVVDVSLPLSPLELMRFVDREVVVPDGRVEADGLWIDCPGGIATFGAVAGLRAVE
jgi:arabinofuranosyltransferase